MHNDAKEFTAQVRRQESGKMPNYVANAAGLLRCFWEKMDVQHQSISDAELKWLSNASDSAQLMAGNLGKTLAGVASAVAFEGSTSGLRSGAFQPYGLEELLYGAADIAETIQQMCMIGSEADFLLRNRYKERAEHLAYPLREQSYSENQASADLATAARAATARASGERPINAAQRETENA